MNTTLNRRLARLEPPRRRAPVEVFLLGEHDPIPAEHVEVSDDVTIIRLVGAQAGSRHADVA